MKFRLFFLSVLSLMLFSCEKPEGEGGKSSISGTIYYIDYKDDSSFELDTFPAMDEDVYIVYGSGSTAGDDVKTNYDGEFRFEHLTAGDYSIYTYARDRELSEISKPQIVDVSIGKKEDVEIPNQYIYASSKGHSLVSGKVLLSDYTGDGLFKESYYAGDVDVYLAEEGVSFYIEKVKTHHDGTYQFPYLRKGKYYVYAYSDNQDITVISDQPVVVSLSFEINSFGQSIVLDDLLIND